MTETRKVNPRTWLAVDIGVGDMQLPIEAAVRLDGLTMIKVGESLDTLCDVEQLTHLIDLLTIARDSAAQAEESFHEQ